MMVRIFNAHGARFSANEAKMAGTNIIAREFAMISKTGLMAMTANSITKRYPVWDSEREMGAQYEFTAFGGNNA